LLDYGFFIYSAGGQIQKVAVKWLKLLGSDSQKLLKFCPILQPIRNQFPWFAKGSFISLFESFPEAKVLRIII